MPTDSRLSPRLGRYLAACAAVTAAAAHHAAADVNYWANANLVIPANIDGLYINVEARTTGSAGTVVAGWDINPYSATTLTWFNATGTGMLRYPGVTTGSAGNLPLNTPVAATGSYGSGSVVVGANPGNWQLNATNYFGFRFVASDGLTHYGWGKFVIGPAINGADRTITDLAWQTEPNTPILVGDTGGPPPDYDPCATFNPTASVGANNLGMNLTTSDSLALGACGESYKTNFFKFVAPATGEYFMTTCASGAPTKMGILDGCDAATANVLACSDTGCGAAASIRATLNQGSAYYVTIGADNEADTLPTSMSLLVYAPYDPCATGNPALAIGTNTVAANPETSPSLDMGTCGTSYRTNYYKFVAPIAGTYTISSCGTPADTKLAVLDGCAAGSAQLACNDNGCGTGATVTLTLATGATYYVAIGSDSASTPLPASMSIQVDAPPVPTCETAPAVLFGMNTFGNVSYAPNQLVTTNATGTATTTIGKAAWYKFTPGVTGLYTFSLCGSVNDTKMAIGTVCPSGTFTSLAYNDDTCACSSGCGTSLYSSKLGDGQTTGLLLNTELTAGTPYYIVIGGFSTTTAPVSGNLEITGPPQPSCPADLNDDNFVNGDDLGILLSQWGECTTSCSADFNGDNFVNGDDLGVLLAAWGACP